MKNIIFDWKRTLYDPSSKSLIQGAIDILELLNKRKIDLTLIGKGGREMHEEVKRLNVEKYFSHIEFNEGDKKTEVFEKYIDKNPEFTYVIGDRATSELKVGKVLGASTIWVRQGEFASEFLKEKELEPDYAVASLAELKELLERL